MSLEVFMKLGYKEKELKNLIKTTILNDEIVYLDFSGIVMIDEQEYIELFCDYSGDIEFLKKIRIREASPGVKHSLYMALNRVERKIIPEVPVKRY